MVIPFFPNVPDLRPNDFDPALPPRTYKSNILHPKKPRDFLLNMYFGKPDYEESHRKMLISTIIGVKTATFVSLLNFVSSKNKTPKIARNLLAKNFVQLGGASVLYGTVATAVANIRGEKDDIYNHGIAGASLGFIAGFAHRSSAMGAMYGVTCAIIGMLVKNWHLEGREMLRWMERMMRSGELNYMGGDENKDWAVPSDYLGVSELKYRPEN